MTQYLFLFTIGPVQSFIAQARKTQDLYAGSKLLSDLIEDTINELKTIEPSAGIIFPNTILKSKPNRFIAILTDPKKNGVLLEEYTRKNYLEKAKAIKNNFSRIDSEKLDSHLKNFLEIYWNAIPLENNTYTTEDYSKLERELGEVKCSRKFFQLNQDGEANRKCSLCGERDVILFKGNKPAFLYPKAELIHTDYRLEEGEGLCGICLNKRLYNAKSFDSTAEIALMDVEAYLLAQNKVLLNKYKEKISSQLFDFQLFYEENLNREYLTKQGKEPLHLVLDDIKRINSEIRSYTKQANINLQKYYAIVVFDGDSMGKWLSGDKDFVKIDIDLKEFHKALSEALGKFANVCSNYLTSPKGKSVYAGGDDFLGFVNLSYLLNVLDYFYGQFEEQVNKPLNKYFQNNQKMSFSAGIAIAHYKTPLSEVINSARAMEVEAKSIDKQKNAFAFTVLKHSGETQSCKLKWKDMEGNSNLLVIESVIHSLKSEDFSNTYIQSIVREFARLLYKGNNEKENKNNELKNILETEITRLISRSCNESDKTKRDSKIDELSKKVNEIYFSNNINRQNPENFFSILTISDFIRKHINNTINGGN